MKSNNTFKATSATLLLSLALLPSFLSGCGKQSTAASGTTAVTVSRPNGTTIPVPTGANVVAFTVNGTTCSAGSYQNKPCVTVTLCSANTTTSCQTISDILLDTGSYGLRVFKSVVTAGTPAITTTPITAGSNQVAECVEYGDGTKQWGTIVKAAVGLGGETPVTVPIQLIDSTYMGMSANCASAMDTPANAGFNGILGVGLFKEDCGSNCVTGASNGLYFSCTGGSCTGTTLALANQVQNPIPSLASDNNGLIIQLPNIPTGGVANVTGYMVLGIGTQANNTPSGVSTYTADTSFGEFKTTYNGQSYDSFLDTGSNALSFPSGNAQLPDCGSSYSGWYCPASTVTLSATNISNSGTVSGAISFPISNFINLFNNTSVNAFIDIGSASSGNIGGFFDWGLPFFFGRNTYIGMEGTTSTLGTGPYWAY